MFVQRAKILVWNLQRLFDKTLFTSETIGFSLLSVMTNTVLHVFIKFEVGLNIWRCQRETQFGTNCYIAILH